MVTRVCFMWEQLNQLKSMGLKQGCILPPQLFNAFLNPIRSGGGGALKAPPPYDFLLSRI